VFAFQNFLCAIPVLRLNSGVATAFQIHAADNVATLLEDGAESSVVQVVGAGSGEIRLSNAMPRGHKVALREIGAGEPVIKFGVRIGHALELIPRGAWVHLHNLASDYDARSGSLDLRSGAPTDTSSAYV